MIKRYLISHAFQLSLTVALVVGLTFGVIDPYSAMAFAFAGSTTNFDRYDLATSGDNVREQLTNVIYNISPTEVPFTSNVGRGKATNTLKEWQIDELAAADTNNSAIDGADFGTDSSDEAQRIGAYQQISIKYLAVSRRANIVNKAGRKSELAYQIAKKGKELKRDVEAIACNNQATRAGTSSQSSLAAGIPAWLTTNTSRGALGADPALSNTTYGEPTTAATDGTVRALTETLLLDIIRQCYVAGGDPNMIMVGPTVKQRISNFMYGSTARIATQYQDQGKTPRGGVQVVGAVDVYVSDFSILDIVPNRFSRERDVFVLDTEYWEISYLDAYKTETIAKIGDAERRHILVDWGVCSHNEAASGIVADVDSTAAMTA